MESITSYPKHFFGPVTEDQRKKANQGPIYARWIKKAEIGVRSRFFLLPATLTIVFATRLWRRETFDLLSAESKFSLKNIYSFRDDIIIAPLVEEIQLRGILQPILIGSFTRLVGGEKDEWNHHAKMAAIVGQAIIFGGLHGELPQKLQTTFSGIVYGILKEKCAYNPSEADKQRGWIPYLLLRPVYFAENLLPTIVAHATNNGIYTIALYVFEGLS